MVCVCVCLLAYHMRTSWQQRAVLRTINSAYLCRFTCFSDFPATHVAWPQCQRSAQPGDITQVRTVFRCASGCLGAAFAWSLFVFVACCLMTLRGRGHVAACPQCVPEFLQCAWMLKCCLHMCAFACLLSKAPEAMLRHINSSYPRFFCVPGWLDAACACYSFGFVISCLLYEDLRVHALVHNSACLCRMPSALSL
jgi:hypothetical protein